MLKNLLLILLFLGIHLYLEAQSTLTVDCTVRPRFEFRDGYKKMHDNADTPAAFTSQRTRLGIQISQSKLSTKINLFDYRIWGDEAWKKDAASVGLHEAWLALQLHEHWKIKAGRQELSFDNNRLISPVNWNQIGASHDALNIEYSTPKTAAQIVSCWSQNRALLSGTFYNSTQQPPFYKNLNILWLSHQMGKISIRSLSVADGYQKADSSGVNYRFTSGLIVSGSILGVKVDQRLFVQRGTRYDDTKIRAWYLNTDLSLKINRFSTLSSGYEIMSGTKASITPRNTHSFDILYGGRHKFNGRMDYFSTPATTGDKGLINPYLSYSYQKEATTLRADCHLFYQEVKTGNSHPLLGKEIDLTLTHRISKNATLSGGYSLFKGTDTLAEIQHKTAGKLNHWAFFMLNINPSIRINSAL